MSLLAPDIPFGQPAFALSEDQIATVLDIVCRGADAARADIVSKMLEVPITVIIRKAMRRVKRDLGLTNLQIRGEHELENMATTDGAILGRIDITLQFLHQFGNEDAYVAIECKRVAASQATLNANYVSKGVNRFVTGQYSAGHECGFMLGYVIELPAEKIVQSIDKHMCDTYGQGSKLSPIQAHSLSLALLEGVVTQSDGHVIKLRHIFVDMLPAA
jgi:hypothetical protein